MGNSLTNRGTGYQGDTRYQGDTNVGFALPAGQIKATLLTLRISSLKQSLKWKTVCTVPKKGGDFPGGRVGTSQA